MQSKVVCMKTKQQTSNSKQQLELKGMAITRSQQQPQQVQVQQQPQTGELQTTTPEAIVNTHLEAVAPYIAAVKVDSPEVWETAYGAASDPHVDTTTADIVHLLSTTIWLAPTASICEMTPDELADQMHKIKFAWGKFGMYAMTEYTDPNPAVKVAMACYHAGNA